MTPIERKAAEVQLGVLKLQHLMLSQKFNENHDEHGRFASGDSQSGSGGSSGGETSSAMTVAEAHKKMGNAMGGKTGGDYKVGDVIGHPRYRGFVITDKNSQGYKAYHPSNGPQATTSIKNGWVADRTGGKTGGDYKVGDQISHSRYRGFIITDKNSQGYTAYHPSNGPQATTHIKNSWVAEGR